MKLLRPFAPGLVMASAIIFYPYSLPAVEIVPATLQDISAAMGPDARGLSISQESLPDLFALTANRIDEDAMRFTVQRPYTEGRWKGGRAVIEYARDLSYTLVSVYDKAGRRQRIYSVSTQFTKHVEHLKARAQSRPAFAPEEPPVPVPEKETPAVAPPPAPSKPSAVETETKSGYEWDEAKAAYVPVAAAAPAPGAEAIKESPPPPPPAAQESAPPARTPSRKAKRVHREYVQIAASAAQPAKVRVADTVWTEKVPGTPTVERSAAVERPVPKRKRRHHKEAAQAPAPPQSPGQQPVPKRGEQWVPQDIREALPPIKATEVEKGPVVAQAVPSEEELLGNTPEAAKPPPAKASKEPPAPQKAAQISAPTPVVAKKPPEPSVPAPVPAKVPEVVKTPVTAESVPSTEELLGMAPAAAKQTPSKASKEPAAPQKAAQAPAPTPVADNVPSTDELLASKNPKAGPDTSAGDAWVPKEVPKPVKVPSAESGRSKEPVKVAMIPKAAPVDNSIENILKISKEGKPGTPHEGDAWVPQKTKMPKPEVDIDREVARIRAQEDKQAAQPRVERIKKDINNPEEGVLPVSTFEKFMGPMYGRHREYERRFVPGKKRRAKVPEHDFFVDEVDRKKEIHNVYYYVHQKGMAPKLVAVERHDKVSFLGNYDIEKENKGKISTY